MMAHRGGVVIKVHTSPTGRPVRPATGWLHFSAAWVDAHLIPTQFSDHRADILFELSELVERVPLVWLANEARPADQRVVMAASAEQTCTATAVATGVIVDPFSHRVDGDDVADELPQRVTWEASVKFGRVVDEDGGDPLKVFALTDTNHRAISLHATDHRTRLGGLWPQLENGFEFGCRDGREWVLGLSHALDRPRCVT